MGQHTRHYRNRLAEVTSKLSNRKDSEKDPHYHVFEQDKSITKISIGNGTWNWKVDKCAKCGNLGSAHSFHVRKHMVDHVKALEHMAGIEAKSEEQALADAAEYVEADDE